MVTGRNFYALAIAGVGYQQFFNGDFHSMILPPKHAWIPALPFWAFSSGIIFIAAGVAIIFEKKARAMSLILGVIFLAIFCFYYIPYELIIDPYYKHLGEWGDAEKELALSGGAFVIAGSFPRQETSFKSRFSLTRLLEMLIPFGRIFFSITMISFGIDHLLYTKLIAVLVPGWIPGHIFWTYFAAAALIGSGIAIVLNVKVKLVATLLGTMIFIWFIIIHIPNVMAPPLIDKQNQITSTLSALAFSGTALVIAWCKPQACRRITFTNN